MWPSPDGMARERHDDDQMPSASSPGPDTSRKSPGPDAPPKPTGPDVSRKPTGPDASRGSTAVAYARAREADVALRDGSTLHVRPVSGDDRAAIHAFLKALSPEALGFRFFGAVDLDWVADWSVEVDDGERIALVATTGSQQTIVAHAAYVRTAAIALKSPSWSPTTGRAGGSRRSCSPTWRRSQRSTASPVHGGGTQEQQAHDRRVQR